jgi:hypothetical protein
VLALVSIHVALEELSRPYAGLAAVLVCVAAVGTACSSSSSTSTAGPSSLKCQIALNTASFDAGGGTGTIAVTAQPECEWAVSTPSSWISDVSPTSGQGSGQITFRATANPQTSTREGEIVVNDAHARITQQGSPCLYDLNADGREISAGGGSGSFAVTAQPGCSWTAKSAVPWISITDNASGNGSAEVSYAVQTNSGVPRSGSITVANRAFVVNQESGISACTYTLSSTSAAIAAGTSSGSVTITTGTGCAWTAASNAPWITVTGSASGTGNGTVSYSAQANTGAARSGTISLAGRIFTLNQGEGLPSCSYLLSSSRTSASAAATSGSVNVSAGSGCGWSAVSNVSWITVTGGTAGNGNGAVTFSVSANTTSASRSGTLAIAGQTYTVEQASSAPASCAYQVSPTSVASPIAAPGGSGSFNVIAASGCGWTAASGANWITFSGATTGSGNGGVSFAVAANTAASARSGVITVEGQTFTVNQAAAAAPSCMYQLSAMRVASPIPATGGSGAFNVIAANGCAWTATSDEGWITFSGATAGSGNGGVSFTVAANTASSPRSGVITVEGRTFTVNQMAASCTYSLTSSNASVNRAGNPEPSFTVITTAGCSWRADSNVTWITANPSQGTGRGTVKLDVSMNRDARRSGTVTVAGQTFTINQAGRDDDDAF